MKVLLKKFIIIFLINPFLSFFSCSSENYIKCDLQKLKVEDYISDFYMGHLGTLPIKCEIEGVEIIGDSVIVSGYAYDSITEETMIMDVWISHFVEKKYDNGFKYLLPFERHPLITTKIDGKFRLVFYLKKDDIIFIDAIGYYPAIFKIYDFLNASKLLQLN